MASKYKKFTLDFMGKAWVQVTVHALNIEEAIKKGHDMKLCDKVVCVNGTEFMDTSYKFIGAQQTELFDTTIEGDD